MVRPVTNLHTSTSLAWTSSQPKLSALQERASSNWEKVILFSNTALIITGMAVAFFAKLPLVMIGLGAYGVAYLALHITTQKASVSQKEQEQTNLTEQLEKLEKKVQRKKAECKTQSKKLTATNKKLAAVEGQLQLVEDQRDLYQIGANLKTWFERQRTRQLAGNLSEESVGFMEALKAEVVTPVLNQAKTGRR